MCHAQPSVGGGSSPGLKSPQKPIPNLQVALATLDHATTGASPYTGMSNVTYHPYSDFAVHHMGSNLADGISQGAAGPDEFRTAPLWGLGQRLFFLHDGRTADLLAAIQAHFSPGSIASARKFPHSSRPMRACSTPSRRASRAARKPTK